jgi:hypothetical protein
MVTAMAFEKEEGWGLWLWPTRAPPLPPLARTTRGRGRRCSGPARVGKRETAIAEIRGRDMEKQTVSAIAICHGGNPLASHRSRSLRTEA